MTLVLSVIRTTWHDALAQPRRIARDREALAVIILTLLPWCIDAVVKADLNALQELGSIAVFITFYWVVARYRPAATSQVRKPGLELTVALALVALWILYRIGQYWKFFILPEWNPASCNGFADTVIPKIIEMAIVPFVFLLALKYSVGEMGLGWNLFAWVVALVPAATLIAEGLTKHSFDKFATSTACYYFAAGLPEEFVFRAFLQTRFEAFLRRPLLAVWLAAFIFGASHVPIDLHGSFEHWQDALLTAFTYQMGVGVALGYAYMRVRNVLPLSVLHAFIDAAP